MIPYLMILRMVPVPPNWTVNLACPHLGVDIVTFWLAAFLGILGLSAIHTTIGSGLDQMTSSDDIHLLSWHNFFAFCAVLCGAVLPITLRRRWESEVAEIEDDSGDQSRPQIRELSTLPTILFDATDIDNYDPEAPIGSLGLIGIGRSHFATQVLSLNADPSLLAPGHDRQRRATSFDYVDLVPMDRWRP